MLLVASANTSISRVQEKGKIRSDESTSERNQAEVVRFRDIQVQSGEEKRKTEVGELLRILREDQLSMHRKYSDLRDIIHSLRDRLEKLENKKEEE